MTLARAPFSRAAISSTPSDPPSDPLDGTPTRLSAGTEVRDETTTGGALDAVALSELSMIAHMRAGSVRVALGDRVQQGDPLGLLGSSDDTVTPHVHYQLQDGPDWEFSDGLPVRFTNVNDGPLVTRTFFHAR